MLDSIIVLPEIQFLGSARPIPTHWKWLNESLAADIPGCRILDFEYSLKESNFSWLDLLDLGGRLFDCIISQNTRVHFLNLMIVFGSQVKSFFSFLSSLSATG
jgi:hypothetical protein